MWDLEAQKVAASLKEHRVSCTALAVPSNNLNILATASQDTNVKVWDLRTSKSVYTLKGHEGKVNALSFSPSTEWIASGDEDGIIKVWGMQNSKVLADLRADESPITCLTFNPQVYALASGHLSKSVRYWDLEEFRMISEGPVDSSATRKVCFTHDGRYIFSANNDTLKVRFAMVHKIVLGIGFTEVTRHKGTSFTAS